MHKPFDVLGIGNAIVDVFTTVEDAELEARGLVKGTMQLITEEKSIELYATLTEKKEISGGAAANSMVGIVSLGGTSAYVGVVKQDLLGQTFCDNLTAQGVHSATRMRKDSAATARSFIMVTPDGERTMSTFLGACTQLEPTDVDPNLVSSAQMVYLEGYLFDPPAAKRAFYRVSEIARAAGKKVALTLSDPFCVDRHRQEFLEFIRGGVDVLFANEEEIKSLYQQQDFDAAVSQIRHDVPLAALTRSEKGSVLVSEQELLSVPAKKVPQVVDTTGAGDLYAAGFLYGYVRNLPLTQCATIGSLCASEVIAHVGARPLCPLRSLLP